MLNQQPHDEWKLEQGLAPAELPLLDQTIPPEQRYKQAHAVPKVKEVAPTQDSEDEEDAAKADDIAAADEDPAVIFAEERPGWRGQVAPGFGDAQLSYTGSVDRVFAEN